MCPAGETNVYSGHIVVSNNANDADGNYLCLPASHDAYTPQTQSPLLNLKDAFVTGSDGVTIPCAACSASGRSAVFTYPDNSVCPAGWKAEYSGYYAANPKWPGENICIDGTIGTQLSCSNLAVIVKGSLDANGYSNVVSCVVCTI